MNVRAIFIDMDGTLLKSSNYISNRNLEAIYRLINQGVKVFLAILNTSFFFIYIAHGTQYFLKNC